MTELGCTIPPSWLMVMPFASFFWDWKYAESAELVTNGKLSRWLCFLLLMLKSIVIAMTVSVFMVSMEKTIYDTILLTRDVLTFTHALSLAIIQSVFNSVSTESEDEEPLKITSSTQ